MMANLSRTSILSKHDGVYPFVLLPEELPAWWDSIEPLIASSVAHSRGTVTVEGIKHLLCEGKAVCIGTAREGEPLLVTVVHLMPYQTYSAARVIAMAGRDLEGAMLALPVMESWARDVGAVEIEGWCRPAVARLLQRLGWKPKFTMMTYDLRRSLQ